MKELITIRDLRFFRNGLCFLAVVLFLVWISPIHTNKNAIGLFLGLVVLLIMLCEYLIRRLDISESNQPREILYKDDYYRARNKLITKLLEHSQMRLKNKLALKLPINISGEPTTYGTSQGHINAFQLNKNLTVEYDDLSEEIGKILQSHGRILIIGEPGCGKTTTLLSAAIYILNIKMEEVKKSKYSKTLRIPVILNLATWEQSLIESQNNDLNNNIKHRFKNWYKKNLAETYNISLKFAEKLIEEKDIIPFFDGFDEIVKEYREDLLKEIRAYFGTNKDNSFVISSRWSTYNDIKADAPVFAEFKINSLTIEQIRFALAVNAEKYGYANKLLDAIDKNLYLEEAILNPFYLDTASFLFEESKEPRIESIDSTLGVQKALVQAFVENQVTSEKDKQYLHFFANKMNEEGLISFELLNMQPSWYSKILNYHLAVTFVSGLAIILMLIGVGLVLNVEIPLRVFLVFFIGICVFNYLLKNDNIEIKDKEVWEWKTFTRNWNKNLVSTIIVHLILALFIYLLLGIATNEWFSSRMIIVIFTLFLFTFLFIGLKGQGIIASTSFTIYNPYQRFWADLKSMFWMGPALTALIAIFSIIQEKMELGIITSMWISAYTILYWVSVTIGFTMFVLVTNQNFPAHFILRFLLYQQDKIPFDVVGFMGKMSKNSILEDNTLIQKPKGYFDKHGAMWHFRHRILQDYFADEKLGELYLDDFSIQHNLGVKSFEMKNFDKAIDHFNTAKNILPKAAKINLWLGLSHYEQKEFDVSLTYYEEFRQRKPYLYYVYHLMGLCYSAKEQFEKAIQYFTVAITLEPNFTESHLNLADAHYKIGDKNRKQAIEFYQKAAELAPNDISVFNRLSLAFNEMGEGGKAMKYAQRALELNPMPINFMKDVMLLHLKLGKETEVVSLLEKSNLMKPDDISNTIGLLYLLIQDTEKAEENLIKAWAESNNKNIHAPMNLGHLSLIKGNKFDAIEWYKKSYLLWNDGESFSKEMDSDYSELEMEKYGIIKEEYDDILSLVTLKN